MMMHRKLAIQSKKMNKLMKKAPCGLFSLIQFINSLFIAFVIISTCNCQVEQKIGLILYHSNKWNHSFVQSHNSDIKNNGIYSLAELNFGSIKILNSMFVTTDPLESIRGGGKKVKGMSGYTDRAFIELGFEIKNVKQKNIIRQRIFFFRL